MDNETKKEANREYVERFFHGIASKLMTHPYFSKYAKDIDIDKAITTHHTNIDKLLEKAAAEAKGKEIEAMKAYTQTSQYMQRARDMINVRSALLTKMKACKSDNGLSQKIMHLDQLIQDAYHKIDVVVPN